MELNKKYHLHNSNHVVYYITKAYRPLQGAITPMYVSSTTMRNTAAAAISPPTIRSCFHCPFGFRLCRYFRAPIAITSANTPKINLTCSFHISGIIIFLKSEKLLKLKAPQSQSSELDPCKYAFVTSIKFFKRDVYICFSIQFNSQLWAFNCAN